MSKFRAYVIALAVVATAGPGLLLPRPAAAQGAPQAIPFAFIGTSSDCGGPAGSHIVTAAWLGGMGLPDSDPNKNDPHRGLLLSKNGPTPDCSSAGAVIVGFGRGTSLTELGFDYRNGTHCGAGAPRFNITSTQGFTYFAGCGAGTPTPAPQDPLEWTRVRITLAAQVFPQLATNPPFVFGPGGTQVSRISIVYDEGTDTPGVEDPRGVGLSVIDNIDVNGRLIRSGAGIADGTRRFDRDKDKDDHDDDHDGHHDGDHHDHDGDHDD